MQGLAKPIYVTKQIITYFSQRKTFTRTFQCVLTSKERFRL